MNKAGMVFAVFAGVVVLTLLLYGFFLLSTNEIGDSSQEFGTIELIKVPWMDIAATSAAASLVLEALGYDVVVTSVSVPMVYQGLSSGEKDVFLGNWMPSMQEIAQPHLDHGTVENIGINLEGAKYTLAVPDYVAEQGVTHFSDLKGHAELFDRTIYGIEPGNDGNELILQMIEDDAYGLSDFILLESSEAGMLAEVNRHVERQEWIVFLGWEPHPMNMKYNITYLAGGGEYFGSDYGAANVYTNVRSGFMEERPNAARFFKNLEFTLEMENEIMMAMENGAEPREAAREWLKENPAILEDWLAGVRTADGSDPVQTVYRHLGIE